MTYTILSTRQQDTILFTEVEYNFDGTTVNTEVAHFNPKSTKEIETNIVNRAQSELQKLTIAEHINSLALEITHNETKDIII